MNFETTIEQYNGSGRHIGDRYQHTAWIKAKVYKPDNSIRMTDRVLLKTTSDSYQILLFVLTPLLTGEFYDYEV